MAHLLARQQLERVRLAIQSAELPGKPGFALRGFIGQLALLEGHDASVVAGWDSFADVDGRITPGRLAESGNAFTEYPPLLLDYLHDIWTRAGGADASDRRARMVQALADWQHVAQPRAALPGEPPAQPAAGWWSKYHRYLPWLGLGSAGAVFAAVAGITDFARLPGRFDAEVLRNDVQDGRLDAAEQAIFELRRRAAYNGCLAVENPEPVCRERHLLGDERAGQAREEDDGTR